jgi:hypothetical protein
MHKLNENDIEVSYKIETDIDDGFFINDKGKMRSKFKTIYAYCTFNKINEHFEIDPIKSDAYLLRKNSHEMEYAYCRLLSKLRNGDEFPSEIVIATG